MSASFDATMSVHFSNGRSGTFRVGSNFEAVGLLKNLYDKDADFEDMQDVLVELYRAEHSHSLLFARVSDHLSANFIRSYYENMRGDSYATVMNIILTTEINRPYEYQTLNPKYWVTSIIFKGCGVNQVLADYPSSRDLSLRLGIPERFHNVDLIAIISDEAKVYRITTHEQALAILESPISDILQQGRRTR